MGVSKVMLQAYCVSTPLIAGRTSMLQILLNSDVTCQVDPLPSESTSGHWIMGGSGKELSARVSSWWEGATPIATGRGNDGGCGRGEVTAGGSAAAEDPC